MCLNLAAIAFAACAQEEDVAVLNDKIVAKAFESLPGKTYRFDCTDIQKSPFRKWTKFDGKSIYYENRELDPQTNQPQLRQGSIRPLIAREDPTGIFISGRETIKVIDNNGEEKHTTLYNVVYFIQPQAIYVFDPIELGKGNPSKGKPITFGDRKIHVRENVRLSNGSKVVFLQCIESMKSASSPSTSPQILKSAETDRTNDTVNKKLAERIETITAPRSTTANARQSLDETIRFVFGDDWQVMDSKQCIVVSKNRRSKIYLNNIDYSKSSIEEHRVPGTNPYGSNLPATKHLYFNAVGGPYILEVDGVRSRDFRGIVGGPGSSPEAAAMQGNYAGVIASLAGSLDQAFMCTTSVTCGTADSLKRAVNAFSYLNKTFCPGTKVGF